MLGWLADGTYLRRKGLAYEKISFAKGHLVMTPVPEMVAPPHVSSHALITTESNPILIFKDFFDASDGSVIMMSAPGVHTRFQSPPMQPIGPYTCTIHRFPNYQLELTMQALAQILSCDNSTMPKDLLAIIACYGFISFEEPLIPLRDDMKLETRDELTKLHMQLEQAVFDYCTNPPKKGLWSQEAKSPEPAANALRDFVDALQDVDRSWKECVRVVLLTPGGVYLRQLLIEELQQTIMELDTDARHDARRKGGAGPPG
jgi:hypothetical protein